jgi:hypothetical protein
MYQISELSWNLPGSFLVGSRVATFTDDATSNVNNNNTLEYTCHIRSAGAKGLLISSNSNNRNFPGTFRKGSCGIQSCSIHIWMVRHQASIIIILWDIHII